ncbi:MAG TPA: methyltransferase [Allosphingosinicella sp.]|nr:methyltransferase [Allosphingosinicella sp.]
MMTAGGSPSIAMALLAYFALFFLAAFFWPTWRLWRRHGTNALVLPRDDSAQGLVGRWFRLTLLAIPIVLVPIALGLPIEAMGRLLWLDSPVFPLVGWSILAASLVLVVVAQAQMGASWRIGIDAASQPPLVRTGLFALSRNPIFLGMRLALLGLFLVLPTGATLAVMMLGEALMQIQVRLEEAHLSEAVGSEYEDYRRATRRWL